MGPFVDKHVQKHACVYAHVHTYMYIPSFRKHWLSTHLCASPGTDNRDIRRQGGDTFFVFRGPRVWHGCACLCICEDVFVQKRVPAFMRPRPRVYVSDMHVERFEEKTKTAASSEQEMRQRG